MVQPLLADTERFLTGEIKVIEWFASGCMLGVMATAYVLEKKKLGRPWSLIMVCCLAFISILIFGSVDAKSDLKSFSPVIRLVPSKEPSAIKPDDPLVIMRNLQRGLLVRNPLANRVDFIGWEHIAAVQKPHEAALAYGKRNYVCGWTGWFCGDVLTP
jgi:hypothetical protein